VGAYAAKQAALCHRLAARFSQAWEPVLRELEYQPQWDVRLLSASIGVNQAASEIPLFPTDDVENSTDTLLDFDLLETDDEFEVGEDANDYELDDD
jgi:hypothetical protein